MAFFKRTSFCLFLVGILGISLISTRVEGSEYKHSGYGFEVIGSLGDNNKRILSGSVFGEQEFASWFSLKYTGGYGVLSTNIKDDRNISYMYINASLRMYPFKKYFFIDMGADLLYALDFYADAEVWQFTVAPTFSVGFQIPSPLDSLSFTVTYKGSYVFDHTVIAYWFNKLNPSKGVYINHISVGLQFSV